MQKTQASENYLINGYYYGCYAMVSIETKTSHCESSSKIFEFLCDAFRLYTSFVRYFPLFLSFDFWSLCLWIFMALVYAPLIQSKCIRVFFCIYWCLENSKSASYISLIHEDFGNFHIMDCVLNQSAFIVSVKTIIIRVAFFVIFETFMCMKFKLAEQKKERRKTDKMVEENPFIRSKAHQTHN